MPVRGAAGVDYDAAQISQGAVGFTQRHRGGRHPHERVLGDVFRAGSAPQQKPASRTSAA
jgi:hypothetical protein